MLNGEGYWTKEFSADEQGILQTGSYDHEFDFDVEFETIVKRAEEEARAKEVAPKKMKTFGESKKFAKTKEGSKSDPLLKKDESKGFLSSLVSSTTTTTSNGSESVVLEESNGNGSSSLDGDKIKDKLAKLGKRGPGGRKAPSGSSVKAKKPATKSAASSTGNEKKVKQARV
ncbi:uncharacterized protein [Oscarella lobularis]|uniref:uncharacterized protein n=1 Tax=Oscarella lobularis TaxID=121494 RepID=UPI00331335E9